MLKNHLANLLHMIGFGMGAFGLEIYGGMVRWADQLLLCAPFSPAHPSEGPSDSLHLTLGEWPRLPLLHASNNIHAPSKLARFALGMGAD